MKRSEAGMKRSEVRARKFDRGTTFQQSVWRAICTIPAGKVMTYGGVARMVGKPRAGRAVGMALNRNPYAPEVPCHRVVGTNRSLTGYAGGLAKKRVLLEKEGVRFEGDRVSAECVSG
jgi:methylated-DNA-[protein]-cysteine S-methyltransferase